MESELDRKLMREMRARLAQLQLGIQYCTPLLREQGTPRHMDYLAMLNQNLYAMLRTVSHLELTDGQEPAFHPVTLDLAGLCRKLGREIEGVADMVDVRFICEVEEASLLTEADEDLLERALLNLLANGIEAARRGGGHLTLRLKRADRLALISVTDDGPGFPDQPPDTDSLLPHPDGLGLGLKVAERAAARHGGTLLRLNLDQGAQVQLSIPLHKPGTPTLRSPKMGYESSGGFSNLLVELATVLPRAAYSPENLD